MTEREDGFDTSRAELFEALGHPIRVRILHSLEAKPLGFAELKREVGIESSGHLQFHLGKLTSLVGTTPEGAYTLTDDGKEALRVLKSVPTGHNGTPTERSSLRRNWTQPLLNRVVAIALVILVAGSLGVGFFSGYSNRQTITTTSTRLLFSTTTTTETATVQAIELSRSNGNYSFTIRLNGSTVVKGQEIALFYNMTNISGQYQRVQEVNPLVIPTIYSENGSVEWALLPQSFVIGLSPTYLPNGFSLTGNLLIATSALSAGQKYVLSAGPLIGPFIGPSETYDLIARYYPMGKSLMINTTITIQ